MEHGAQKLLGFPPTEHGSPELFSLFGVAGILELAGGFFILIGLFTRPIAFVLAGEMAFAYWMAHAPKSIYPALNGGDAAILYCFIFLYLVAAGPGAFSVDESRKTA
jgi:putative oxidoreductase